MTNYVCMYVIFEMFNCWQGLWIEVDGASHTLSATAAIFLGVLTVIGFSCFGEKVDEDANFFKFFLQNNEHMELTVLLFFQNPYVIFAHILQHYHDFQSNVAIFPKVVQAYTQPCSYGGRIKQIICQIRHELSVTIHDISTSWKKP